MARSEYISRLRRENNESKIHELESRHKERMKKRGNIEYIVRYEFINKTKPEDIRECWEPVMANDIMEAHEKFSNKLGYYMGMDNEFRKVVAIVEKSKI